MNLTTRAQRALDAGPSWLGLQPLRQSVIFAYALCAVLTSACPAGEYVFFQGEPHEVRIEAYTVDGTPHTRVTAIGASPNLYGPPGVLYDFIDTQALTHGLTVDTVVVELVQELTLQRIAHEQVMQWWGEAQTTIALDRWTLLDLRIPARQSQFKYVGQGSYFDVERTERAADLRVGDVDLSGTVDDDDLSILLAFWGTGQRWSTGDVDGDLVVGDDDLSLLLANWTHVPEPSMLLILCLVLLRRRR